MTEISIEIRDAFYRNFPEITGNWKENPTTEEEYLDFFIPDDPSITLPTWAELQRAYAEYEAYLAETQYVRDREAAMQKLLPETMYLPAILEQAKADRDDNGKTLCPELEEAVNIYSQIMVDNPAPGEEDDGDDDDDDQR